MLNDNFAMGYAVGLSQADQKEAGRRKYTQYIMTRVIKSAKIVSLENPPEKTVYVGDTVIMPNTVVAHFSDGVNDNVDIKTWNPASIDTSTVGYKNSIGRVEEYDGFAVLGVNVLAKKDLVQIFYNFEVANMSPIWHEYWEWGYILDKSCMPIPSYIMAVIVSSNQGTGCIVFRSSTPISVSSELDSLGRPQIISESGADLFMYPGGGSHWGTWGNPFSNWGYFGLYNNIQIQTSMSELYN